MNILIADDESIIREGVKRTIGSACPDHAVHTAASAEEALFVLDRTPIDIVLTDILMPGMTGLELMKLSQRRYPSIRWAVISAHSEFAYAQQAVRQGARDYLLKPIGRQRVIELIGTLAEEIRIERLQSQEELLLKQNLKLLREAAFCRLASGLDLGNVDIGSLVEQYREFYLVMVRMNADRNVKLEHFIVENVMDELFDRHGDGFVVSFDAESLLGLVTLRDDESFRALFDDVRSHLRRCLRVPFQLLHAGPAGDLRTVPEAVARMRQAAGMGAYEQADGGERSIEAALQYIRGHYHEDLSLEKVASVVFLNPVYFSQLFKQKTGEGYKEYVTRLRMEQACKLLAHSGMKLADIAERIGYQDVRHFTQMFRKRYAVTPTEYRQQRGIAGE